MNVLAVIPARGGSKRIPRKNLQTIQGRTLVEWTIQASLASKQITKTIFSTGDPVIKTVSLDAGAEVMERIPELSVDEVSAVDVVLDVLEGLESSPVPDIVVMLLPTCPQRRGVHIDQALDLFRLEEPKSLISVSSFPYRPEQILEKRGRYVSPAGLMGQVFVSNGAIQISTPERLLKTKSFHAPGAQPFLLDVIDVDTPEDLERLREAM